MGAPAISTKNDIQNDAKPSTKPPADSNGSPRKPKRGRRAADPSKWVMAFMDCEFGGLDPELHDITEVAVILTDYRLVEISRAEWKIHARADRISAEGAAIGGYDEEAWRGAPKLRQVLTELCDMLPRDSLVIPAGQNVRMDVQFLERGFKGCEIPFPFDYHVIDLATLFYSWSLVLGEPVSALSLRQAALTAGLIEDSVPHRAMADTELTLDSFRYFIGRLAPRDSTELLGSAVGSSVESSVGSSVETSDS